ncbi:MAG: hypothetical protein V8S81_08665 [Oscillospiraceae bacterium]
MEIKEFKNELDEVVNTLRENHGLLHNRYDMKAFAKSYPSSALQGNYCTEYGFRMDTEKYAFLFRQRVTIFYCLCESDSLEKLQPQTGIKNMNDKEDR